MKRRPITFVASILVGLASGYICGFLITLECYAWTAVISRIRGLDFGEVAQFAALFNAPLGAILGGVILPCAYLVTLWRIPERRYSGAILRLFIGVLLPSVVYTIGQQLIAFVAALAAFGGSCIWIANRYSEMPNQLPDPTSPSVTPPAGAGGAPSVAADH